MVEGFLLFGVDRRWRTRFSYDLQRLYFLLDNGRLNDFRRLHFLGRSRRMCITRSGGTLHRLNNIILTTSIVDSSLRNVFSISKLHTERQPYEIQKRLLSRSKLNGKFYFAGAVFFIERFVKGCTPLSAVECEAFLLLKKLLRSAEYHFAFWPMRILLKA